ncbi:MAG: sulfurtransferase-like selenium metabolism protein YedF [Prolixibacteraceae bacterium]|jgi:selenium metabolism protein YedF|nr:sulfurtransferase-like selenium metabolism protein YedF [Prolixibacteraceae bacterium]
MLDIITMQTVDGKGLLCPQPLILTRKALKNCLPGETLKIECDNRTAFQNILTYLKDQSLYPEGNEAGGLFYITVVNQPEEPGSGSIDPGICSSSYIVVMSSDKMGEGDLQLGAILMKGFLNSLNEQAVLPTHLVFYNSGVKLTTVDSGVSSALLALEESGTEILICGTCVDFYDIRGKLAVGKISNMFALTETMARAGNIIKP